jgi:probable rRNA maturation factor
MRARHVRGRSRRLRVAITDAHGRPVASAGLGPWLERAAPSRARGDVSIALVNDGAIRRLNREHRGKDVATDVLSFRPQASGPRPKHAEVSVRSGARCLAPGAFLGDLAIATGVARRQAREHGHALGIELRILALHGLLHLLGYDHETDRGRMARTEARLGRRAGLPAVLIGRASRKARRA